MEGEDVLLDQNVIDGDDDQAPGTAPHGPNINGGGGFCSVNVIVIGFFLEKLYTMIQRDQNINW